MEANKALLWVLGLVLGLVLLSACGEVPPASSEQTPSEEAQQENHVAPTQDKVKDCTPLKDLEFDTYEGERLALLNKFPFTGITCTHYPTGKVHTLNAYVEGRREGLWEVYHPNGRLSKMGNLHNGLDEGTFKVFFKSGQIQHEYHYAKGEKTGIWKSWYVHGQRYTERHFERDTLHGKVLVWDEQGQLAKSYDYDHGKLVNSQMHFKE
jgi:antitoxin component YwqK of YwqJK toxin-antitoxin module